MYKMPHQLFSPCLLYLGTPIFTFTSLYFS